MPLHELARPIRAGELIDLITELRRESGSHLNADLDKLTFAASYGDQMIGLLAIRFLNAHREPNSRPIELPHPWDAPETVEEVTPEERERLTQLLRSRSAFAEHHTEETPDGE